MSLNYVVVRLAQIVPTFFLIMVVIFVLVRLLPGDPAVDLHRQGGGPGEEVRQPRFPLDPGPEPHHDLLAGVPILPCCSVPGLEQGVGLERRAGLLDAGVAGVDVPAVAEDLADLVDLVRVAGG